MIGQPVILRDWSVIDPYGSSPYTAPELRVHCLHGRADNHPHFTPDEYITTSDIVGVDGRVITCRSRQYLLEGPPSPSYRAYLESAGIPLDEKNPISTPATPSRA